MASAGEECSTSDVAFVAPKSSGGGGSRFGSHCLKFEHEASSCFQLVSFFECGERNQKPLTVAQLLVMPGEAEVDAPIAVEDLGTFHALDELEHNNMALLLQSMKVAMAATPTVDNSWHQILAFLVCPKSSGIIYLVCSTKQPNFTNTDNLSGKIEQMCILDSSCSHEL